MVIRSKIALACLAVLLAGTARASVVSIPWTLDFTFSPSAETSVVETYPGVSSLNLANFGTDHEVTTRIKAKAKAIFTLASVDVTAGLGFPTTAEDSYHVYLPFDIRLTAPDHAIAGQNVFVQSSIGFSGSPIFSANGKLSYATDAILHGSASLGPFDASFNADTRLPDSFSAGGSGLTLGGSGTYASVDDSADKVSVGPFARSTLGDSLPVASSTAKFEGNQLVTEGSVDAQRGELNLLSILRQIPGIGAGAAALDAVSDLDLEAGVELSERSIFSTGAIYALYSEYGGIGERRATVLNGVGQQGFNVAIPLDAGERYAIDLYGLGLGLGLQREMLLQPELQLVFDPILFGEWTIFEKTLADPWLLGRQQSRFQYEEIFSDPRSARFIAQPQRLLSFAVDAAAPPPPPPIDPGLPAGLDDAGAGMNGTIDLPGTAPDLLTASYVPEPSGWAMMIVGFGLVGTLHRRRSARAGRAAA